MRKYEDPEGDISAKCWTGCDYEIVLEPKRGRFLTSPLYYANIMKRKP